MFHVKRIKILYSLIRFTWNIQNKKMKCLKNMM
jgi:hypothetical protein